MDINQMTLNYVKAVSEKKKYNLQSKALNILFNNSSDIENIKKINVSAKEFFEENKNFQLTRDFYFKKDSFTPRNVLLVSPLLYIYYTNIVFKLFHNTYLVKNNELNFSLPNINSFYSGNLKYSVNEDENFENADYGKSFNKFQNLKQSIFGKYVIKFDIKDFFNSISTHNLINKLKIYFGESNTHVLDLEYFFNETRLNYLPQFHYSIASSILSQFYLRDFDNQFMKTIGFKDLNLIRFVDDMFLYQDNPFTLKDFNTITDKVNSLLWKEELTLNLNKTKLYDDASEFERTSKLIDFEEYDLDGDEDYIVEEFIRQKAKEIIFNKKFFNFLMELNTLYQSDGMNIQRYKELLKTIADEDHSKIFNNIMHSGLWRRLPVYEMKELLNNWNYIYFNPSQFTILFFKIEKFLNRKLKVIESDYAKNFATTILNLNNPTFREVISINIYLSQGRSQNYNYNQLSKVVSKVDYNYFKYIDMYVI